MISRYKAMYPFCWTLFFLVALIVKALMANSLPNIPSNDQNKTFPEHQESDHLLTSLQMPVSDVQQHENIFKQQFEGAEYIPRMEVIALGLNYNNETATLNASIYVGVPSIYGSQNAESSKNVSKSPLNATDTVEKFTSYEIYLTAVSDIRSSESPSSCLSDIFLQHSFRDVSVGCPLQNGRESRSEVPLVDSVNQSHVYFPEESSCVDKDTNDFTVVFRHVYSGYYCILIQPQVGSHTRRTFTRMARYQTSKLPTDITEWQTTIDLQPIPSSQCISAAFILPDSSYQIVSHQLRVDLLQVSGDKCNDPEQIRVVGTKIVVMEPGMKTADVEFMDQPPGVYCIVVIGVNFTFEAVIPPMHLTFEHFLLTNEENFGQIVPIDERCNGNSFWKTNGRSCARHSAKSVQLLTSLIAQERSDGNKPITVVRTSTLEIWATFTIICAFCLGLALVSLLGTVVIYRRRHKKRLKRQQNQLLIEWGPTAEVSPVESGINIKPIQSGNFSSISASVYKIKTPITFASAPIPVLLLYRRDVPQVSQRSSELRKQLQLDCGNQIKVYDYGDETQWEEMAVEGLDWLPNRIYGNLTTNRSMARIIVIHSPVESIYSSTDKCMQNKLDRNSEDDSSTSPLLNYKMNESEENKEPSKFQSNELLIENNHTAADHEFLYGMQLLQSSMRETVDHWKNTEGNYSSSLYKRVFNVRFTDLTVCQSSETENQDQELVYPNLQVAPFTSYLLPGHYNQLLQHLTSSE